MSKDNSNNRELSSIVIFLNIMILIVPNFG